MELTQEESQLFFLVAKLFYILIVSLSFNFKFRCRKKQQTETGSDEQIKSFLYNKSFSLPPEGL